MSIFYFNPGHETAVLNASPYYMAPANVVAMQKELCFLPAWYGNPGDVVLVESFGECQTFYSVISAQFPSLPKPIDIEKVGEYPGENVVLWGISPQAVYFMKNVCSPTCTVPAWNEEYLLLHSREIAKECLEKLVNSINGISTRYT